MKFGQTRWERFSDVEKFHQLNLLQKIWLVYVASWYFRAQSWFRRATASKEQKAEWQRVGQAYLDSLIKDEDAS